MEEIRRSEEMSLEELEAQHIDLLPDREEMYYLSLFSKNTAIAVQGSTANAGNVFVIAVED